MAVDIRNLLDQLQEIFYTIEKNKLRTVLTGLTVSWGIFMLILLLGSGHGLENGVQNAFQDDAVNSLWVIPGQTSAPHKGLKQGRHILLETSDVGQLSRAVKETEQISGRFYLGWDTTVRYQKQFGKFQVVGVESGYMDIENAVIINGRTLNPFDDTNGRKVALIGIDVNKELFPNRDAVGQYIRIKDVPFLVVGVFDDPGDQWTHDRLFIPMTTMQTVFNKNDRIHNIAMTIQTLEKERAQSVESSVRGLIAKRHHFSRTDKRALFIHNTLVEYNKLMDLFTGIRFFIWIVGIGSIVAGIVSISNIMLIAVKERTREIGIRKALGATPDSVVIMILVESILITLIFGYLGLVAGIGFLELMDNLITGVAYFKNPEIHLSTAFGALAVLVVSGALAGIFPAGHAARIRPADALRDE